MRDSNRGSQGKPAGSSGPARAPCVIGTFLIGFGLLVGACVVEPQHRWLLAAASVVAFGVATRLARGWRRFTAGEIPAPITEESVWHLLEQMPCAVVLVGIDQPGGFTLRAANARARTLFGLGASPLPRPFVELECRLSAVIDVSVGDMLHEARQHHEVRAVRTVDGVYDLILTAVPWAAVVMISIQDVTLEDDLTVVRDGILSSVSHELRTPLTNVCAVAEILTEMPPENAVEAAEFLAILRKESLTLSHVVASILEYSRLRCGDVEIETEPIDAIAEVSGEFEEWQAKAHEAGVQLAVREALDPDEPRPGSGYCLAARRPLRKIVHRLIENAIRFTPRGGRIEATVGVRAGLVDITVADSGAGVRPEHRDRIFDSFEQLHDGPTDKPAGLGLGLAISRHLVRSMGGEIRCEASDLGGAAFVISLPAAAPLVVSETA